MVLPTFELRLLTPTGDRLQIGPIATHTEASALARSYIEIMPNDRSGSWSATQGCQMVIPEPMSTPPRARQHTSQRRLNRLAVWMS